MNKNEQIKNTLDRPSVGADQPIQLVDVATLAGLLFADRNHFFRAIWASNQNKRLKKTGDGKAYKQREVRKLYVATVRNDFSFKNRVAKLMEQRQQDIGDWQPQARTWGEHVQGTPFVVHENEGDDNVLRLYGHFLPIKYWTIDGQTGYYVDGAKKDDAVLKALEYARSKPKDELGKARLDAHPVNTRLDDMILFKISGQWYQVVPPTKQEVESLARSAMEFAKQVEQEAAAIA